ncbi:hypothetical protein QFC24_000352 [Naganishia onofrii]|uniref:Uncharacterized protein n=1 Tax=Naganishia onofrii TaxID=1851511 RepID=A0ACC2XWP3_9TREE|nr:hypothetical protein QFC24_000352 [Naganishia onofrii]
MYRLPRVRNFIPLRLAVARRPPLPSSSVVASRWVSTPAQPSTTTPTTMKAGTDAAASTAATTTSPMVPAAEAPGSVQPSVTGDVLTVPQYERLANETMETLYDALEALVEEWSPEGTHGWEIEYSVSHSNSIDPS